MSSVAAGDSIRLWRIATEARKYGADDLTGAGAAHSPGRWNEAGVPVVCAATTVALAVLETAAHADNAGLPLNRFLVCIEVPKAIWESRATLGMDRVPPQWAAIPAGRTSANAGMAWLESGKSVLLRVPSVIVAEELAVLINPAHPDAQPLKVTVVRPFGYDKLFGRTAWENRVFPVN